MFDFALIRQDYLIGVDNYKITKFPWSKRKECGYRNHVDMPDIIASPNHNKARQNISFYLHNINKWKTHESTMNWYSNYNKTKLNKIICILYGMYCVCSNGSIRSQWSLLLTWSPFDASPIIKLFMILVSRTRRHAAIPWATILEPYHLVTSLQVVWNQDIRGWADMFALGPLLLKEIGETIIEICTW